MGFDVSITHVASIYNCFTVDFFLGSFLLFKFSFIVLNFLIFFRFLYMLFIW